jgi:anti-sigma28 factor (negative regulator of flagellin synthesis)
MKITANASVNAAKVYSKNSLKNINENIKGSKKYDSIEISNEGGKIAKYVSYANDTIDVRQKKVEDLKNKINTRSYNVSSEDLASEILKAIKEERESI